MIKGVIDLILADATCASLIGEKVFPVTATQEIKKPYVTIRRISQGPTLVKGQAGEKDQAFFIVGIFSSTYASCMEISTAIRNVLDDYNGVSSGITYHRIWYQNSEDMIDEDDEAYVILDTYVARVNV